MAKYVPSPRDWVREQVELYENSGGTKGTTLRDTGLPVVLVTHWGNKTGAIRKTPLMRVKDGDNYILIGSQGGAPKDPAWAHNLRVNPHIELRDETIVRSMRVREVKDAGSSLDVSRGGIPAICGLSGAHKTSNSSLCRRAVIHPISVQQLKRTRSRGGQQREMINCKTAKALGILLARADEAIE